MPPPNGTVSVTNGTQYGAEVYFQCDTGFRLEGNASSVCNLTGQWELGTPTCQLIGDDCPVTEIVCFLWSMPLLVCFKLWNYVFTNCITNFSFVSIDCGNLLSPENGMLNVTAGLHGNNTLLASATYTCDLGFNMSGPAQRTCTETSEWLPGAPNCTLSRNSLHFKRLCTISGLNAAY